ncbi:MAG: Natural resistance-associated macrophage protein [Candidatus Beckwithbacteria bacterium GW2011_GWB1_47_15]|uniref:Natural resistance-associated macrophage protein n=1 Tax=Candidatus Beckwithbacteria bacterium GW2011_GWB1_47_15 TaxID=1618371 RepID=A0A0G1RUK5_9BACT|nr:MAG: natural resistance-associated macrophage protein [Candidatus Beckwithbacteria bacterium GW2011_GWC1_49_16]KKU35137.1 MAG: Natural resistance-associated macrophage protein [Candidatus Beckwithbacteria bacterium GW2011_GWA1_46_30]KKU60781.1 MAG: Natural resistance-associated macrophage protein [Candidatus Beckwithbacteria bacterium GW2011_GWB1_47_15]KKU71586.1 MAG: Natural resistance-associated macrophage protein [Candidatus Beckwithbacteria bacterium GW2011_GWA2_47_25]KKW03461.1 MAG: Nat
MPATKKKPGKLKRLLNGFIIGNADNDPAGVSTYTITGAQTGFSLVLFHILSTPLLINSQAICARIGDVTKKGLASVIRLYYGLPLAVSVTVLVAVANIFTLGADFAGVAAALHLIFPGINIWVFLPLLAGLLWYIIVFKTYPVLARVLAGMGIIFLSYIATAVLVRPDWLELAKNVFLPQIEFTPNFWLVAVAMLGTTITPFLFYWQVTEEVEDHPSVRDVKTEIGQVSWGLIFSNLTSTFIIITSALTLFKYGVKVQSAADAALVLQPLAGNLAALLFAIGLIGSGILAIPVLTSTTAYTVAETFNWRSGLNRKVNQAKGFYAVLTLSFFVGLAIALMKVNPIKILFYSQVVNGVITPFILALILKLASKEVIMNRHVIGKKQKFLGWLTVLVMLAAAIGSLVSPS